MNAFLLYKDITKGKGEVPMHQKRFRETLVDELAAAERADRPAPSATPQACAYKWRQHHRSSEVLFISKVNLEDQTVKLLKH